MNNYYTPEIEEFYVGFECEIQSSYGWQKGSYPTIFQEDTSSGFEVSNVGVFKTLEKTYKYLRVKYLDKEDILSLGFKLIAEELKSYSYWCQFKKDKIELHVQLNEKYFPRILNINGGYIGNLRIKVKNKSEFKKLMQQLGIL